jgi:NAD(P)-dependent dehydrogenase (short-subunit alcohol dehydrogenase family)
MRGYGIRLWLRASGRVSLSLSLSQEWFSPQPKDGGGNADIEKGRARTPLSKIATPMDVAYQIAILASQKVSGHLTGQVVRLHGGMEGESGERRAEGGVDFSVESGRS